MAVLLCSVVAQSQDDSSRVEQYCQLIATRGLLSNKVTIDIDYGEEKDFWRGKWLAGSDGKIKKFNTIIDAFNYVGLAGWVFVNALPVHMSGTEVYHFTFKKQFLKTEVTR